MPILDPNIELYISQHSDHLSPLLHELERETYLKAMLPNMISGKEQGNLLYTLIKLHNPMTVLELGTFTGYSAICIAMALNDQAKITTLDINEEISWLPLKYFELAQLKHKIDYRLIPALDYINTLTADSLDTVFIDADKQNYAQYVSSLKPKLRSGGLMILDNVLWQGKILAPNPNADTRNIIEATRSLTSDPEFVTTILPLRDGMLLAYKR